MELIKNWASGVIVAVIIATLIEMILPDNKNKKYIKTVIGVYILFTIISPIISNALADGMLDISKYEKYLKVDESYNNLSTKFHIDNTDNIKNIYQDQIKADIKTKLKAKGYNIKIVNLEISTENEEEYGSLESIELVATCEEESEENESTNQIQINKIEIGNTEDNIKKEENIRNVTEKQKDEIKKLLQEEYGIKKENISFK